MKKSCCYSEKSNKKYGSSKKIWFHQQEEVERRQPAITLTDIYVLTMLHIWYKKKNKLMNSFDETIFHLIPMQLQPFHSIIFVFDKKAIICIWHISTASFTTLHSLHIIYDFPINYVFLAAITSGKQASKALLYAICKMDFRSLCDARFSS